MKHVIFEGPEAVLHPEVGEISPGVNLLPDDLVARLVASGPAGRFRLPTAAEDLPPAESTVAPDEETIPLDALVTAEPVPSIFDHAEEEPTAPPSRPRKGKE